MANFNINAINNLDQIVGEYSTLDWGDVTGFSYKDGVYTKIYYFTHTWVDDINDLGMAVGHGTGMWESYSYDGTNFTRLVAIDYDNPIHSGFIPEHINNQGIIIGSDYYGWHSLDGSTWKDLQYPGSTAMVIAELNNFGKMTGWWTDSAGKIHGFQYDGTEWISIDYPGATETSAYDINDEGLIIGNYVDSKGKRHGYSYDNGIWSKINYPGATETRARLVNNDGWIVGSFTKDGKEGQFLAKPTRGKGRKVQP
ncbi:MAG: hypothetical protein ACYDHW_06330 [Syntrophorhabdaceae bacterium]